jgi:hypothetical protein
MVADNLNKSGYRTTRFLVAKELSSIQTKRAYKQEIIDETRRLFELNTGLTYEKALA